MKIFTDFFNGGTQLNKKTGTNIHVDTFKNIMLCLISFPTFLPRKDPGRAGTG